jgi:methylglutaconyl-CoA hydratase
MTEQVLEIEERGDVLWVWMNRPSVHNALDEELIAALGDAFRSFSGRDDVSVIVLSGRGKSFCAGADADSMRRQGQTSPSENLENARLLAEMLRSIASCSKPTIARVNGAAIGGGLGLVAACDIAIAANEAVFAMSEVRLGLIPATIGPYVVQAIGARWARRLFLTGERINAPQAAAIQLVHEIAEREKLDEAVSDLVTNLRLGGPGAQRAAKELTDDISCRPITPELIDDTAVRIARVRAGDEAREGLSAFLEKRKPKWARE